ncbi:ACT domain-containing protein [Acrocarpospora sp. B8E8]|uniref:ACT domain-containing protein n=1 Tax=Acrocarpospora sp. B8E8 TaxID=3153572 RepID=UPI00325CDF2E
MLVDEVIHTSSFMVMPDTYWMYRTAPKTDMSWAAGEDVFGIIDDGEERTIILTSATRPADMPAEAYGPLVAFRVRTSKPFAAPGFLASLCGAVAATETSVLALSTFTFDYIFVRNASADAAEQALAERGLQTELP